jgi:hypothetical protein
LFLAILTAKMKSIGLFISVALAGTTGNALSLALFGEDVELEVYGVILEYEEVSEMSIP